MSDKHSVVVSSENVSLIADAAKEGYDRLGGELSTVVNLLLGFGLSRYKALANDAIKNGKPLPGEGTRASNGPRAPRTPKTTASRDAVTDMIKNVGKSNGEQLPLPQNGSSIASTNGASNGTSNGANTSNGKAPKASTKTVDPKPETKKPATPVTPAKKSAAPKKSKTTWIVQFNPNKQVYMAEDCKTKEEAIANALENVPGLTAKKILNVVNEMDMV